MDDHSIGRICSRCRGYGYIKTTDVSKLYAIEFTQDSNGLAWYIFNLRDEMYVAGPFTNENHTLEVCHRMNLVVEQLEEVGA